MSQYVDRANAYIEAVLSGKIVTCKWTKLACQRQVDDLARSDFPYFFSDDAVDRVCGFLEVLTHVKGKFGGMPLHLEDWECFAIACIFGWKRKDDPRLRRFRRSFLSMGKSNGKSFLSSGISAYMLAADDELGSEVLCVARSKQQAQVVFDTTREILRANPQLCALFDIKPLQETITHGTNCVMRPATNQSKSLAGSIPHFIVGDETWAWGSVELLEECERAIDKRDNSLFSTITHAAADLSSVGYQQHETACAVLTRELIDERTFCCMWSSDGYPWTSDDALKAANPNLGVSVYEDTLKEARDRAVKVPALQVAFRAKNLCEWLGADVTWLDQDKLVACRQKNLHMPDFKFWLPGESFITATDERRPFTLGIDLSKRMDLCCVVYLTMKYVEGVEHYYAFGEYYLPEETLAKSPIAKYRKLAATGNLCSMPGPTNDIEAIQKSVLSKFRCNRGYGLVENPDGYSFVMAAYDSWQAQQMQGNLDKAGIPAVSFEKTTKYYSPTMENLAALIAEGRFHFPHEDDALLWCLQNVVCHRDRNDNLFPNKPDDERKIDCAISLLYALRAAMTDGGSIMRPVKQTTPMFYMNDDGNGVKPGTDGHNLPMEPLKSTSPDRSAHPADMQGMFR